MVCFIFCASDNAIHWTESRRKPRQSFDRSTGQAGNGFEAFTKGARKEKSPANVPQRNGAW